MVKTFVIPGFGIFNTVDFDHTDEATRKFTNTWLREMRKIRTIYRGDFTDVNYSFKKLGITLGSFSKNGDKFLFKFRDEVFAVNRKLDVKATPITIHYKIKIARPVDSSWNNELVD